MRVRTTPMGAERTASDECRITRPDAAEAVSCYRILQRHKRIAWNHRNQDQVDRNHRQAVGKVPSEKLTV